MSHVVRRLGIAALSLSSLGALAAGNAPITDDRTALRSVLTGVLASNEITNQIRTLSEQSQNVIDQGLQLLAAATTPDNLAAAGIIDVPCAVSGTLRARMASSWPRVARLEWSSCARDFFGTIEILNGPGEVVLVGNSFSPTLIASLRLGDRSRDVTLDSPVSGSPTFGGTRQRYNVRYIGVLPMTRAYEFGPFTGRYAYEVTGFLETTQLFASFPDTGPPFYAQVRTFSASGAIVTGEFRRDPVTANELRDNRVLLGTLSEKIDVPVTPRHAGHTYLASESFQDVHVVESLDYPPQAAGRFSTSIDGKAETNIASYYGFKGCTAPETWTWRTKQPFSVDFNISNLNFPDRGELVANERATGTFSITGTEANADQLGHLDIAVRGLGAFNFTSTYSPADLAAQAGCAP